MGSYILLGFDDSDLSGYVESILGSHLHKKCIGDPGGPGVTEGLTSLLDSVWTSLIIIGKALITMMIIEIFFKTILPYVIISNILSLMTSNIKCQVYK